MILNHEDYLKQSNDRSQINGMEQKVLKTDKDGDGSVPRTGKRAPTRWTHLLIIVIKSGQNIKTT